ncbi:phage recombination protein Bet [Sphingomonas panaciterrae]|uniref:phage recombination protein Bet n=1 Tax=Sphingomonas panaciterrae TaxID=1462999 RepID=UPI002FEEFA46
MATQTAARRAPGRQPQGGLPATQQSPQQNVAEAQRNAAQARQVSALDVLASRLNISAGLLQSTLLSTVFKNASKEEFAALVIVANEYGLNPLTKEMYAFPQKGGGIVPLVSIDGWIRIMNNHPQYDGIEFTDIADEEGKLIAIEAVIYRKDRTRPIRVTEYLDECRRETDPWKKSPARMLRHRALIQCARIAFGFSGIYTEDDAEVGSVQLGGDLSPVPMRDVTPNRQLQDDSAFDPQTGEIGAQGRGEGEGPTDEQRGEEHRDGQGREVDPQEAKANEIIERAGKVEIMGDLMSLVGEAEEHIAAMSDPDMVAACRRALSAAEARLKKGGK